LIETTQRFLREIAEKIGLDRITEIHLFPPMRQGGIETGVAVIAAIPPGDPIPENLSSIQPSENSGVAMREPIESLVDVLETPPVSDPNAAEPPPVRHTVFSAQYRHTLKGADRGKWEVDVKAEADAPLATVDDVVRGVMKRASEPFEPERLSAGEVRAIVTSPD
jgi:hypothetical protein